MALSASGCCGVYNVNGHKSLQHPGEVSELIAIFAGNDVKSYLEIGSKFGGSLWTIACSLPKGSRLVSVDLPHGKTDSLAHLRVCIASLKAKGYDAHLIIGDSTAPEII